MKSKADAPSLDECATFVQAAHSFFKNIPFNVKLSELQEHLKVMEDLELYLEKRLSGENKREVSKSLKMVKRKIKAMMGSLTERRTPRVLEEIISVGEDDIAPLLYAISKRLKSASCVAAINYLLSEVLEKIS